MNRKEVSEDQLCDMIEDVSEGKIIIQKSKNPEADGYKFAGFYEGIRSKNEPLFKGYTAAEAWAAYLKYLTKNQETHQPHIEKLKSAYPGWIDGETGKLFFIPTSTAKTKVRAAHRDNSIPKQIDKANGRVEGKNGEVKTEKEQN